VNTQNDIKVVIINASPRPQSNTMVFANHAKNVIESLGGKVTVENLAKKDIKYCIGCWSTNNESCVYPCIVKDDLNPIFENMINSDGIIFVSGVYWFGVTAQMKTLVDRMTCLWNNGTGRPLLDGKVAAFISSGVEEGNVSAMAPLMATATFLGMHILPYGLIYGDIKEKKDFQSGWGLEFAERCGRNMVNMIKLLKENPVDLWGKE